MWKSKEIILPDRTDRQHKYFSYRRISCKKWMDSVKSSFLRRQRQGKVLSKLLNLCTLNLNDIYFTECCKCLLPDRKNLRKYATNCKEFLFRQIEKLNIDIILPMGQFPTETILDQKINKLSDYVGKQFEIYIHNKKYTVIPIYHTSPINPLSYKGNEDIFKNLSKMIKSNK